MPEPKKTMAVLMKRGVLGEETDATGDLVPLKIGETYTVSEKFGRWLCFQGKAVPVNGGKVEPKSGPITTEDFKQPTVKGK